MSWRAQSSSPDGRTKVVGHDDGYVLLVDTETNAVLKELEGTGRMVNKTAVTDDRRTVVSSDADGFTVVWHLSRDGAVVSPLNLYTHLVYALALTSDGRRFATGHSGGFVSVWDSRTGQRLLADHHKGSVVILKFTSGGRAIFSACRSDVVSVWDSRTKEVYLVLHGDAIPDWPISISKDDNELVMVTRRAGKWKQDVTPKWKIEMWSVLSTPKWGREMAWELSHFF